MARAPQIQAAWASATVLDLATGKYGTVGAGQDEVVLQAAIDAASQSGAAHWLDIADCPELNLGGPIAVGVNNIGIKSNGGVSSGLSTIKNDIVAQFAGDVFVLGTDDGKPWSGGGAIQTAVSTNGGTKVQYTCKQGHGLRNVGNIVTVSSITESGSGGSFNVTSVAVTDIVDAYSFKVANTTTKTYTSGGTMAAVNAQWDGTAEGFTLHSLRLLVASAYKTTALVQTKADHNPAYGKYAAGSCGVRDWRGGSVQFRDVFFDGFDFDFWGVFSDQNTFDVITSDHSHVGLYFGPKCGQTEVRRHFTYHSDFALIIDGDNNVNIDDMIIGQTNGGRGEGGSETYCTLAPIVIGNSVMMGWSQGSFPGDSGTVFKGLDLESSNELGTETTHTEAFIQVGMGHAADGSNGLEYPIDVNSAAAPLRFGAGCNVSVMNNQTVGDVTLINPYGTSLTAAGGAGKAYVNKIMQVGRCLSVALHDPTAPAQPMNFSCVVEHATQLCDNPTGGQKASHTQISLDDVSWSAYTNMTTDRIIKRGTDASWVAAIGVRFRVPTSAQLALPPSTIIPLDGYCEVFKHDLAMTSVAAAWNSGTAYVIGDCASVAGVDYVCILGHTNHTPPNATYWIPLVGAKVHSDGRSWKTGAGAFVAY